MRFRGPRSQVRALPCPLVRNTKINYRPEVLLVTYLTVTQENAGSTPVWPAIIKNGLVNPYGWGFALSMLKNEGSTPSLTAIKKGKMAKVDKKRKKLQERIDFLNDEMRISLTKKDSSTKEISLPEYQKKIGYLQKQLKEL
jgi:hypothetical protein